MNRPYEIFKTPSGPSTGKALLNHAIFSPSQTGETVPLSALPIAVISLLYAQRTTVCEVSNNFRSETVPFLENVPKRSRGDDDHVTPN